MATQTKPGVYAYCWKEYSDTRFKSTTADDDEVEALFQDLEDL